MGRFFVGAVAGAVVTVALMYLMQALIFTDTDLIPDDMPVPDVDILREVPEEGSPPERPTPPPRPTEDDIPPEIEQMPPPTGPQGNPVPMPVPPQEPVGPGTIVVPTVLMPLVRVEPEYPRSAITRGAEGFAVVGFTVAEDGTTRDIEVLASEPGTTFDSASTRAVGGWIYQPQSDENGNPIAVPGQTARFDFNFDDGSEE